MCGFYQPSNSTFCVTVVVKLLQVRSVIVVY